MYIKQPEFNKMYKWNYEEDFWHDVACKIHIPKDSDIVVECWINDNIVDLGNSFADTVNKLRLILGKE